MKRLMAALIAVGPMVGCMETAPYRNVRPVGSTSALMEREIGAAPAGLSDADRAAYIARRYPGRPAELVKPAEPVKTHEQQVRERKLAEEVKREEAIAKSPWRGWSAERIEQEARENSIFPMQLIAHEEEHRGWLIGINMKMDEIRVGENMYGDQVLQSALYLSPYRDSVAFYATLACDRGLMDTGGGLKPVTKWDVFGELNKEWVAFGSICTMAKAMQ